MAERRGRGRPRENDSDTSAAISRAAMQRFAAQGFDAATLREIAGDAGVDVALISYRFGGKLGLWKDILSQAGTGLREALERTMYDSETTGAHKRLEHSAHAFLAYLLHRPEVPRLLLRDITIDSDRSQWLLETLSLPLHQHFIANSAIIGMSSQNWPGLASFSDHSFGRRMADHTLLRSEQ